MIAILKEMSLDRPVIMITLKRSRLTSPKTMEKIVSLGPVASDVSNEL